MSILIGSSLHWLPVRLSIMYVLIRSFHFSSGDSVLVFPSMPNHGAVEEDKLLNLGRYRVGTRGGRNTHVPDHTLAGKRGDERRCSTALAMTEAHRSQFRPHDLEFAKTNIQNEVSTKPFFCSMTYIFNLFSFL